MRASFNVLDRAWIPVRNQDGKGELLGVRETLARAHELRELSSASPLEEYSLYRFLGLFLMDALRPESETDIEDLLEAGSFDTEALEAYIVQCHSEGVSFDLFDEERPFLQSKYDPETDGEPKPAAVLDFTRASGNNHTHFDHAADAAEAIPPDKAARLLPTYYTFVTMGGRGYGLSINQQPPYFGLIKGDTLFQTLTNTLLPIDSIGFVIDDPPVLWRRQTPVKCHGENGKTSWMEAMLFPARRISLIPETDGTVRSVFFSPGEKFLNPQIWYDPYVSYKTEKDKRSAIIPQEEVAIWRNIVDILDIPQKRAFKLLVQYHSLHPEIGNIQLLLFGVETNQAKYLQVYRHDLSFPEKCMNDDQAILALRLCIRISEKIAGKFADILGYSIEKQKIKGKYTIRGLPANRVKCAIAFFYEECGHKFWDASLAVQTSENFQDIVNDFYEAVIPFAMKAFDSMFYGMDIRSKTLVLAEKTRKDLYSAIMKIKKEESL